jgi:hypothetical protein
VKPDEEVQMLDKGALATADPEYRTPLAKELELVYCVFDLLFANEESFLKYPLWVSGVGRCWQVRRLTSRIDSTCALLHCVQCCCCAHLHHLGIRQRALRLQERRKLLREMIRDAPEQGIPVQGCSVTCRIVVLEAGKECLDGQVWARQGSSADHIQAMFDNMVVCKVRGCLCAPHPAQSCL